MSTCNLVNLNRLTVISIHARDNKANGTSVFNKQGVFQDSENRKAAKGGRKQQPKEL